MPAIAALGQVAPVATVVPCDIHVILKLDVVAAGDLASTRQSVKRLAGSETAYSRSPLNGSLLGIVQPDCLQAVKHCMRS